MSNTHTSFNEHTTPVMVSDFMSIAFPIAKSASPKVSSEIVEDSSLSDLSLNALAKLKSLLTEMEQVVVAFSGGVDSALVLDVAHEVLGDRAINRIIGYFTDIPTGRTRNCGCFHKEAWYPSYVGRNS